MKIRTHWMIGPATTLLLACVAEPIGNELTQADTSAARLLWHPQSGRVAEGEVIPSKAKIQRKGSSVLFEIETTQLPAGRVITAHAYVFKHPELCTNHLPSFNLWCHPLDLLNEEVEGSTIHLGGATIEPSGALFVTKEVSLDDGSVCYPDQPCHNGIQTVDSGILLCLRDHGVAQVDPTDQFTYFTGSNGCPSEPCFFQQFVPQLAPQITDYQ